MCAFALSQMPSFKNHNTLMLVKHSSGAISCAFEMGYYSTAYQRAVTAGDGTEKSFNHYVKKMHELALGLIEKVLQVIYDIAKLLQGVPSPWFRLPLTLSIAAVGLIKVWVKTGNI